MRNLSISECKQISGGIEEIVVVGTYTGGCYDPYQIYLFMQYYNQMIYASQGNYYYYSGGGGGGSTNTNNTGDSEYEIDADFISQNEGGQHTDAYTLDPDDHPNAGVTVGTGIDLGHTTEDQLRDWGATEDEIDELRPYLGLQGEAAEDYLNSNPLTITENLADRLDQGALESIADTVATNFNADNATTDFADLPQGAQTAIVDLAYQYGPNLEVRTPNFWDDITNNNWQDAVDELNNFGDIYDTRREAEADLIQDEINSGGLAPGN